MYSFASELRVRIENGDDATSVREFADEAIRRRFDIHDMTNEQSALLNQTIENASQNGYESGTLDVVSDMIRSIISERASIEWATRGHTNVDVNVYAFGPQSGLFAGHSDNTVVGRNLAHALGLNLDQMTSRLQSRIPDPAK